MIVQQRQVDKTNTTVRFYDKQKIVSDEKKKKWNHRKPNFTLT